MRLPDLKVIARRGICTHRLDTGTVRDLGRVLAIGAGGNLTSVADHALALILAVARRLRDLRGRMNEGDWRPAPFDGLSKIVGLLGHGRIARKVVDRLVGFETNILVATRDVRSGAGAVGERFVDLETLLRASDVLTLHAA